MNTIEKKKDLAPVKAKSFKENTSTYSANFKGLVDLVWHEKQVKYLVNNSGNIQLESEHKEKRSLYKPPQKKHLPLHLSAPGGVLSSYQLWKVDSYKENQRLFADLVRYLKQVSDLPKQEHYPLLAAWVMHTYRQEDTRYSPILCFYAVAERGKTRTGKALANLAYRGTRLTSLREASIFRLAENLRASLFFDISDMWDSVKRNECEDILLNRFETGSTVPRVLHPEKGAFEDTHYYEVFGPTIIATNTPLNDILETRSIVISMVESSKKFSNEVRQDDVAELRDRLLAFRAFYLNETFPETEKLFSGRLGDILRPLHSIIQLVSPEHETKFIQLANEIRIESMTNKAMTREGLILQKIISLEHMVRNGILSIEEITDSYNIGKPERFHISTKSVGRIAQSLGFYSDTYRPKTSDGKAAIPWDEQFIASLARSYGLEYQPDNKDVSEFSGLSDLLRNKE